MTGSRGHRNKRESATNAWMAGTSPDHDEGGMVPMRLSRAAYQLLTIPGTQPLTKQLEREAP
jgi:hypothetical protein